MTVKRIAFLQELLSFMGLGGRLHLEWISSAEAQKFVQVITDFTEKIRSLGPNPLIGASGATAARRPDTPFGETVKLHNTQLKLPHRAGMDEEATHEIKSETVA